MIIGRHQMQNALQDVDRMVAAVKAVVCSALESDAIFRCEVCTAEVLTNIVKHASSDAPIDIRVTEHPDAVIVEICDPEGAKAFDPRDHVTDIETVDPLAEGGRGLGLIMRCADSITYRPIEGHNHIALTFNKTGAPAGCTEASHANQSGENYDCI